MLRYILKRLVMMIPVLIGVSFVIFTIMSFTPGDPARMVLGDTASFEEVEALRDEWGLNDPFFVRYFKYLFGVVQGDFGKSYRTNINVTKEIVSRLPYTFTLALGATCVMVLLGVPIGILSAVKQYTWIDTASTVLALMLSSIPLFWLGLMIILVFAINLKWFPATGADTLKHFVLPWIALGAGSMANIIRMTRSSMLEVIRSDYIRTARAKGAAEKTVIFKHALRNALLPIITVIGLNFGALLGGALISEQVFAIPGLGTLLINSVRMKDVPLVEGVVLFIAFAASIVNLIVDILYAVFDPRIKAQYAKR